MPITVTPDPFRILVVCTGNICRSPAVERLLAARLGPHAGVQVTSAGTGALVGHPVHEPMVPYVTGAGADVGGFAARQVNPSMLDESDVVVALTRAHRAHVVDLAPAVVRRVFTLRELARLAREIGADGLPAGTTAERLATLVALAAPLRGVVRPARPEDDDVVDPYGRPDPAYAEAFAQIQPAVDAVVAVVRS